MPIYEYKCKVCEEHFEVEQSFTEETLTTIDGCSIDETGQHQVRKIFAAPAISFKGDGFYRNDARSTSNGKSKSKAGAEESKSSESTEKESSSSDSSSSSSSESSSKSTSSASSGSSSTSTNKSLTSTTPSSSGD